MSETAIRWAAASQQLAENAQQQAQQRPPGMTDQQRDVMARMSPEQCFHLAYSRTDDDAPRPPEAPHPASLQARRDRTPANWRHTLDQAWSEAFAPLQPAQPEAPWSAAIRYGQQTGVLNAPEASEAPTPALEAPATAPAPTTAAAPSEPFADLFGAMKEQLDLFAKSAPPSDEAQLRNLWRSLPEADRQAIAEHVEASDFAAGYFRSLEPDWAAVLTGDALCSRLADARRLQPDISPEALLQQVLAAAKPHS